MNLDQIYNKTNTERMKCRLELNSYCDENFQIEFKNITELKDLHKSLGSMIMYYELCKEDGEEIPDLVYKIKDNLKNKKR